MGGGGVKESAFSMSSISHPSAQKSSDLNIYMYTYICRHQCCSPYKEMACGAFTIGSGLLGIMYED